MQLRLHPLIGRAATLCVVALVGTFAKAQDLLANQAPVDRQMNAIDSVSFRRLIQAEEEQMPAFTLYNEWRHNHVASYSNVLRPNNFRIDLRHFAMPTTSRRITSQYGYRRRFGRFHKGLDIKVYIGDTIVSAFAGKVRVVAEERRGYGKYIVIRHPNGLETVYGHLSRHLVVEDQVVQAGEPIGLGGNTGRSTGSHLHFETRLLGDDIDPALLFDFVNQDVVGDYYVYQGHGRGYITNADEGSTRRDVARRGEQERWQQSAEEDEASARAAALASTRMTQSQVEDERNSASRVYRIRPGDSLGRIARLYGTTINRLCALNNIRPNTVLRVGRIIKVN